MKYLGHFNTEKHNTQGNWQLELYLRQVEINLWFYVLADKDIIIITTAINNCQYQVILFLFQGMKKTWDGREVASVTQNYEHLAKQKTA